MLLCMLLVSILAAVFPQTARASAGYEINRYVVNAVVKENAVLEVTEHISTNYLVSKHGIYRDIPLYLNVNREVNGKMKKFLYRVRVTDVNVEGAPFELSTEGGARRIIIGDKDRTITGPAEYVITYKLDMGDDRISEYDELFYNFIGNGWDVGVDRAEFHVTFEKDTDLSGVKVYAGAFEDDNTGRADVTIGENRVDGSVDHLRAHESVTIFTRLPEGYFVGARKENQIPAIIFSALLVLLACYTGLRFVKKRGKNKVTETVEFYPPDDMSSAEVGYIIDGMADDKDLISLIFWLAHKGYLQIEEKSKKEIILRKQKEIPPEMPKHIRMMFNGIFKKDNTVTLKQAGKNLAKVLPNAKLALSAYFFGPRKLEDGRVSGESIFCCIVGAVLFGVGIGASDAFLSDGLIAGMVVFGILALAFSIILLMRQKNRAFVKKSMTNGLYLAWILAAAAGCVIYAMKALFPVCAVISFIAGTLALLFSSATICPTEYKLEVSGKLLGLRTFIEKAELERLEKMVEENPSYFYDVLPFAYVFGLTDKWAKKFETIRMEEPDWWIGNNTYNMYFPMYLARTMNNCVTATIGEVYKNQSTSKGTSISGGGFSGGGFGGGGGGSW